MRPRPFLSVAGALASCSLGLALGISPVGAAVQQASGTTLGTTVTVTKWISAATEHTISSAEPGPIPLQSSWKVGPGGALAEYQALMKFNVSLPVTQLVSAHLELVADGDAGPGTALQPARDAWSTSTTWTARPRLKAVAATVGLTPGAVSSTDVTALAQSWLSTPASNLGFALVPARTAPHTTPIRPSTTTATDDRPTLRVRYATTDRSAPVVGLGAVPESVSGTVDVAAGAGDDAGVSAVMLQVDGTTVRKDARYPYTFSWDSTTVANGSHELAVVAVDFANRTARASTTVTVDNTVDPVADVLDDDLAAGRITVDEYVEYASYAAMAPFLLPSRYAATAPSGSEELMGRMTLHEDQLSPAGRQKVQDFLARLDSGYYNVASAATPSGLGASLAPGSTEAAVTSAVADLCVVKDGGWFGEDYQQCEYLSHNGRWRIVFSLDGYGDGISPADQEGPDGSAGANGVPDHVDRVVHSLDRAYDTYVTEMGYDAPDQLHLEVRIGGIDSGITPAPGSAWLLSDGADIRISSDGSSYGTGYLPRHEFFHSVQWQYAGRLDYLNGWADSENGFVMLLESGANWAANRSYAPSETEDSTHYAALNQFLGEPGRRLSDIGGGLEYSKFLLPTFLTQRHGDAAFRSVWERIGDTDDNAWEAIGHVLGGAGDTSTDFFHDFAVANYRIGESNSETDEGYVDEDESDWVDDLAADGRTAGDATDGHARAARRSVSLSSGAASGTAELVSGATEYVDLTHGGDISGRLRVRVSFQSTSPSNTRATLLAFGSHASTCTAREDLLFLDPLDEFSDEIDVRLPEGCRFATLVLTHPQPGPATESNVVWSATWQESGDKVHISGLGAETGAVEALQTVLESAGYDVTTSAELPADLADYDQLWWLDYRPFSVTDAPRLSAFVNDGGSLYLTGERPCCEDLNEAVGGVLDSSLADEHAVQVGRLGDPYYALGPVPTNPGAIGGLSSTPFDVDEVVMDAPGGLAGVGGANVIAFAPGSQTPVAAAWDEDDMYYGRGRIALVMDVNWLDPSRKGATADQWAQNLALFLSGGSTPPGTPVSPAAPSGRQSTTDLGGGAAYTSSGTP